MKYRIFILVLAFCFIVSLDAFSQNLVLGKKFMSEKKFDEAYNEFIKFKKGTIGFEESQYNLGLISSRKKEYDKAETYLKQAINLNANKPEYHLALGALYGQMAVEANPLKQGLLAPKIKSAFENAARLDPKNLESRWMLINFYIRAPKIMGGDIEKGKIIANEIMKINQAEGNRAWGTIWRTENKNDLAEKNYKASITLAPDSIKYYFALARFYEAIPDIEKALDTFLKTAKKFPENRMPYLQIGRIIADLGKNLDEGEKALNKFISLTTNSNDKNLANAHYYLGLIEKKRGKTFNAKKQFELALKCNPEHKLTLDILKTF